MIFTRSIVREFAQLSAVVGTTLLAIMLSSSAIRLLGRAAGGKIYADARSNAVFLLVAGKSERPVGAELRGTGPRVWRGLAAGTDKDAGYFWIGRVGSRQIVICESAIDAMSCHVLFPERICLSTAGVRSNPRWLSGLLSRGYEIYCGYDADAPGDEQAAAMMEFHPRVSRLPPSTHDWNDDLTTRRRLAP